MLGWAAPQVSTGHRPGSIQQAGCQRRKRPPGAPHKLDEHPTCPDRFSLCKSRLQTPHAPVPTCGCARLLFTFSLARCCPEHLEAKPMSSLSPGTKKAEAFCGAEYSLTHFLNHSFLCSTIFSQPLPCAGPRLCPFLCLPTTCSIGYIGCAASRVWGPLNNMVGVGMK